MPKRLRYYALVIMLLFSSPIFVSAQKTETAAEIMGKGLSEAMSSGKKLFIIFHASWCGWCKKMDMAMADPEIKKYFDDNFVVRHMVVMESANNKHLENPGALELMKKASGEESGIPFWMIYDKNEQVADSRERKADGTIGGNVGCPASENEVNHFIEVLKKTSRINETGLALIRKRFRKIETN